jgi:AcrR family transcriptional regulator
MKLASSIENTSTAAVVEELRGGADAATGVAELRVSRAEKKALSRRRILDSARDVFFREGFMLANLDEVASQAGVAKGTLYRYFESKADLYVAVLAEKGKSFIEKMQSASREGGSAVDRVRAIGDFYLDHWLAHQDYFQIFWAIDNQSLIGDLPDAALDEVSRLWEQSLSILNEVLEEGVRGGELAECDTWEVANILWTTANGLIQSEQSSARRMLRRRPLREVYRDAVELILQGLACGRSPQDAHS